MGTVEQELLLRNEYLVPEHCLLRHQITGRVRLTEGERTARAEMGCSPVLIVCGLSYQNLREDSR